MRSLQECQAEVFRRGERKIRQRKRRTIGILLACIPLCLCLMLLPNSKEEKALDKQKLTGCGPSITAVQVAGARGRCVLTDAGEIQKLMGLMESYSIQNSLADGATGSMEAEPEAAPEKFESQPETTDIDEDKESYAEENFDRHMSTHETVKGYTVTLVMDDGSIQMYTVTENLIQNLQTDELVILTDAQAAELLAFLTEKAAEK